MTSPTIVDLLGEYERALAYTSDLWADLSVDEVNWRESDNTSGIGWHLGHQPAVAHYMVRNLTAAEPPIDAEFDSLMDSATNERDRGVHIELGRLADFRKEVAERICFRVGNIDSGNVGAPAQLRVIAHTLLVAVINHEYQHSKWIGELRTDVHGRDLPPAPVSDHLTEIDGYFVVH